MLQLLGLLVLIFALAFGYEPASRWARGELDDDEALSEFRGEIAEQIAGPSDNEVRTRVESEFNVQRVQRSDTGQPYSPTTAGPSEITTAPSAQGRGPTAAGMGAVNTTDLARQLLEQSQQQR